MTTTATTAPRNSYKIIFPFSIPTIQEANEIIIYSVL